MSNFNNFTTQKRIVLQSYSFKKLFSRVVSKTFCLSAINLNLLSLVVKQQWCHRPKLCSLPCPSTAPASLTKAGRQINIKCKVRTAQSTAPPTVHIHVSWIALAFSSCRPAFTLPTLIITRTIHACPWVAFLG